MPAGAWTQADILEYREQLAPEIQGLFLMAYDHLPPVSILDGYHASCWEDRTPILGYYAPETSDEADHIFLCRENIARSHDPSVSEEWKVGLILAHEMAHALHFQNGLKASGAESFLARSIDLALVEGFALATEHLLRDRFQLPPDPKWDEYLHQVTDSLDNKLRPMIFGLRLMKALQKRDRLLPRTAFDFPPQSVEELVSPSFYLDAKTRKVNTRAILEATHSLLREPKVLPRWMDASPGELESVHGAPILEHLWVRSLRRFSLTRSWNGPDSLSAQMLTFGTPAMAEEFLKRSGGNPAENCAVQLLLHQRVHRSYLFQENHRVLTVDDPGDVYASRADGFVRELFKHLAHP